MIAGVLSCGGTHTLICPLDVVKCNMQMNAAKFTGLVPGLKVLIAEEGAGAIWKGWAPTAIGYSAQGFFKFGFYEIFKDVYSNLAGEENAKAYRGLVLSLSLLSLSPLSLSLSSLSPLSLSLSLLLSCLIILCVWIPSCSHVHPPYLYVMSL